MEQTSQQKNKSVRRTIVGVVKSMPAQSTAIIEITEIKQHPKYKKRYKRTRRFHASTGSAEVSVGQTVTIVEAKPASSLKRWRIKQKV